MCRGFFLYLKFLTNLDISFKSETTFQSNHPETQEAMEHLDQ